MENPLKFKEGDFTAHRQRTLIDVIDGCEATITDMNGDDITLEVSRISPEYVHNSLRIKPLTEGDFQLLIDPDKCRYVKGDDGRRVLLFRHTYQSGRSYNYFLHIIDV